MVAIEQQIHTSPAGHGDSGRFGLVAGPSRGPKADTYSYENASNESSFSCRSAVSTPSRLVGFTVDMTCFLIIYAAQYKGSQHAGEQGGSENKAF